MITRGKTTTRKMGMNTHKDCSSPSSLDLSSIKYKLKIPAITSDKVDFLVPASFRIGPLLGDRQMLSKYYKLFSGCDSQTSYIQEFVVEIIKAKTMDLAASMTMVDVFSKQPDLFRQQIIFRTQVALHDLGMMIHKVRIKPPRCKEEEDIVSSADIELPRLREQGNISSIKEKRKRVSNKHADGNLHILQNPHKEELEEGGISSDITPSQLEEGETVSCIKKRRKHSSCNKGNANDGRGRTPKVGRRSYKLKPCVANEKAYIPDHIEATVKRLGGRYVEWLAEKGLTPTDVTKSQARLYLPIEIEKFLSETEKKYLVETPKNGLEVVVVDHKSETWPMLVKYWPSVEEYILVKGWPQFIQVNDLKAGEDIVEIWTFRQCLSVEEEVEDGNTKKGRLGFALNFRKWESPMNSVASTSKGAGAGLMGTSVDVKSMSCVDALVSASDWSAEICDDTARYARDALTVLDNARDVVTVSDISRMITVEG